jgi:hypothetical protein
MSHPNYPEQHEEKALPGFSEFRYFTRKGIDIASMKDFGYKADSRPKFNAFARRFRLASSMQDVVFSGYGKNTSKGYSALNRHFLMFSAFERYALDCEGIEPGTYDRALQYVSETRFAEIKVAFDTVDTNDVVFDFLLENTQSSIQKRSLKDFRAGISKRNGIYISAMLRNSFVHGNLSVNLTGAEHGAIDMLANFMTSFLYNAICEDFSKRLEGVRYMISETLIEKEND